MRALGTLPANWKARYPGSLRTPSKKALRLCRRLSRRISRPNGLVEVLMLLKGARTPEISVKTLSMTWKNTRRLPKGNTDGLRVKKITTCIRSTGLRTGLQLIGSPVCSPYTMVLSGLGLLWLKVLGGCLSDVRF